MDSDPHIDRLMPRHSLADHRVQIGWDIRSVGKLRRRETMEMGTIVDLSLDGALIEVPESSQHDTEQVVVLRFGGIDGRAVIRHRQDGDGIIRYGIQWIEAELREVVEKAVAAVRGRNSELRSRWEDSRR